MNGASKIERYCLIEVLNFYHLKAIIINHTNLESTPGKSITLYQ